MTTVRISWKAHKILRELAAERHVSMVEYLEQLAEQARRQHIADESAAAMTRVLADPDEQASYLDDLHWAESLGTPGRA